MGLFKTSAQLRDTIELQQAVAELRQCLNTVLTDVRAAAEPVVMSASLSSKG